MSTHHRPSNELVVIVAWASFGEEALSLLSGSNAEASMLMMLLPEGKKRHKFL